MKNIKNTWHNLSIYAKNPVVPIVAFANTFVDLDIDLVKASGTQLSVLYHRFRTHLYKNTVTSNFN